MNARLPVLALLAVSAACGSRADGVRTEVHDPAPAGSAPAADELPDFTWHGAQQDDWLAWRGPHQNGSSDDVSPPVAIDPARPLWSVDISGRGTPVVADGLVYVMGYEGEDATCVELIACLDERTGAVLWQELFPDFLSDVVYSRYSISSPTIDPETGNVYCQTSPGRVIGFTRGGQKLWEHSMMEEYGKLTFPNGRTGAPLLVGDKVIVHVITSSWGALGPARDRFYAFDKRTGQNIWGGSTPGEMPQDNSFSFPITFEREGRSLLAAETGCGHLAVLDVNTGDVLWRFRIGSGANSSLVQVGDTLIGVHGNENADDSSIGRLIAVNLTALPKSGEKMVEPKDVERWRVDLEAFSSSPVVAGKRLYQTDEDGELACVDVDSGELLWKHKLAPDQVHASPLFAAGKLYVPMNNGSFHILEPSDEGVEVLDNDQLEGNCLGAPALANGRLYVHTTSKLYCFGAQTHYQDVAVPAPPVAPLSSSPATRLQVIPGDVVLEGITNLRFRLLDSMGRTVREISAFPEGEEPTFEAPPFLKTTRLANREFAMFAEKPGAGELKVTLGDLKATVRVRKCSALPYSEDFESAALDQPKADAPPEELFGFPPSFWLSCRTKWDVREKDGSRVLGRTIDNPLFQRSISLFGDPEDSNYTVQADVMVEGNRRGMASVGLVNQRYLVWLKGNYQELEISSNFESLRVPTPFAFEAGAWYTLKTRVDLLPNGVAIVRAKCWKRGSEEPRAWTLEVPHHHGHKNGAAGVYGFTLMNRFKAYVDNLSVTPNE